MASSVRTGSVGRRNRSRPAREAWRQLERLSLRDGGLKDVSALSALTGLEVLDLAGNRIGDLGSLGGLERLRALRLTATR